MPYRAKPIFNYTLYNDEGISISKLSKANLKIDRKFRVKDITQKV